MTETSSVKRKKFFVSHVCVCMKEREIGGGTDISSQHRVRTVITDLIVRHTQASILQSIPLVERVVHHDSDTRVRVGCRMNCGTRGIRGTRRRH